MELCRGGTALVVLSLEKSWRGRRVKSEARRDSPERDLACPTPHPFLLLRRTFTNFLLLSRFLQYVSSRFLEVTNSTVESSIFREPTIASSPSLKGLQDLHLPRSVSRIEESVVHASALPAQAQFQWQPLVPAEDLSQIQRSAKRC